MAEATSIRLPEELAEKLNRLTRALDRPKSYVIKKALQEYIEEYEDYLIALERLRNKDDRIISEKELRERLLGR